MDEGEFNPETCSIRELVTELVASAHREAWIEAWKRAIIGHEKYEYEEGGYPGDVERDMQFYDWQSRRNLKRKQND